MRKPITAIITAILLAPTLLFGYNPREDIAEKPARAGGHYFAYPEDEISAEYGKAPEGYEAFYLSHYGRHGSRYLTSDEGYTHIMAVLDSAAAHGALTDKGRYLRAQLDTVYAEAAGRAGELSKKVHLFGLTRKLLDTYIIVPYPDILRVF